MRSRKALRRHSRQAFTLIELLVVIAIIALLVSILLPSLQQAKNLAKSMLCKTQIKGLGTAITLYQEGCGGWVPRDYPYGMVMDSGGSGGTWPTWFNLMIALTQEAYEQDPDYHPSGKAWAPDAIYIDEFDMLFCPMDSSRPFPAGDSGSGSYGINAHMTVFSPVGPNAKNNFYNIQLTKRPDQMYLLFCNLNGSLSIPHDHSYSIVKEYTLFQANPIMGWTPAIRHGSSFDSTHMLDHSGAVSEIHWKDIRTLEGSLETVGDNVRVKGPWLNGLGLTARHDIPAFEYDTIMSLPGHD